MSDLSFEQNYPLSTISSFGIGGNASYFAVVRNEMEMLDAIGFAKDRKLPFFVVGKGSNCLFDDRGYKGLVILNRIEFVRKNDEGIFTAGSGYSFSLLGVQTARDGWSGLEFASGIPGTVGGAVFMNAGAGGQETGDILTEVSYLHENGQVENFQRGDLPFSYRTSPFQKMKGAIIAASFRLLPSKTARDTQINLVRYRTETQPYGEKSAGCVFRNPLGGSAGKLIEEAGLKGLLMGGAQVSPKHANFIVNTGSATAEEIKALVDVVRERVKASYGIELEREVRYVPFTGDLVDG